MKQTDKRESRSDKGTYEALDFHPYEELGMMDPVYANAPIISMTPATRVKPFLLGSGSFDTVAKRAGLHFLRIPYLSRDVKHALAKKIEDVFSRVKDGDPYNWLARHDELRIANQAGTLSGDARPQANYHTHFGVHYLYLTTATVLAHVQAAVFGRVEGFHFSPAVTSTLKFSVINSMLSQFNGMPINRKFIDTCVQAMSILGDRNDKSILVSFPEWLPLGLAYFSDVPNLGADELANMMEYVNEATMRHIDVEEYEINSGFRQRISGSVTSSDEHFDYGLFAPESNYTYSRGEGWFIDKWLHIARGYADMLRERFTHNTEFSRINITQSVNRIADFWFTLGIVDDRLKAGDLAKWVDDVSGRVQDLQDYAAKNWSGFADRFTPMFTAMNSAARSGDMVGIDNNYNAMGLRRYDSPSEANYIDDTITLISQNRAALPAAEMNEWFPTIDIPYQFAFPGVGGNIIAMLQGEDFGVDLGGENASLYSSATLDAPGSIGFMSVKRWEQLLFSTRRYVGKATVGKFLERSLAEANAYCDMSLLNSGYFCPQWKVSPFIDPMDPFVHGVHEILDFHSSIVPITGDYTVNSLPNAAFGKHVLNAMVSKTTAGKSEAYIATVGGGIVADASDNGFMAANKSVRAQVRLFLHFTGDALNVHPLAHLCRNDITRMGHCFFPGLADVSMSGYDSRTILPVMPVRRFAGLDVFQMVWYGFGANEGSSLKGISIGTDDGVVEIDLDELDGTLRLPVDMETLWPKFYLPWLYPSMGRMQAEYTDGGMYVFANNKVDTELSFNPTQLSAGSTTSAEKSGVVREPRKKFGGKRDFKKTSYDSKRPTKDYSKGKEPMFSSDFKTDSKPSKGDSGSLDSTYLSKEDDSTSDVKRGGKSFMPKDKRD